MGKNSLARLAHIEYPAEVDDLISESHRTDDLSFSAAAGYAVVASARIERALLFSIAAGSGSDAIPIALPSSRRLLSGQSTVPPVALLMWLAEKTAESTASAVGVAALSFGGVLRIYPRIAVDDAIPSYVNPGLEVKVNTALSLSVGSDSPCSALHIASLIPVNSSLLIFGSRGSAAIVDFNENDASVQPLYRNGKPAREERSSGKFGSMFYSAFRSIGVGLGARDVDWEEGSGSYKIVDSHLVGDGPILIRRGGDVEKWNRHGLLWSFNVFDSQGASSDVGSVVSTAVTSEETLVLLIQGESEHGLYRLLRCYDVRNNESSPTTHHISIPVDNSPVPANSSFAIVVCCDIVCLFNPDLGRLAWRSVARGVSSEGQVQGSLDIPPVSDLFYLADVSRGLFSSSTSGVAACLHRDGIIVSCFEVPAPISEDVLATSSEQKSIADSISVLWRSFLQYNAGQIGASRASIQGLVNVLVAKGFDISEALSQLLTKLSREILCKDHHTFGEDRTALLIDSALDRKMRYHRMFLRMLSDVQLFTQVRPDAPSIAEDRMWDALDLGCRHSVITDNEKLASAIGVRQVENAESMRNLNGGFNEAAYHPTVGNGQVVEIARALRTSLICENEKLREGLNVVNMALIRVGKELCLSSESNDLSVELYRKPYEFHKFAPALENSMTEILHRLRLEHNVSRDEDVENRSLYLDETRSVVSLSCEAAVALLETAMEARAESSTLVARSPIGFEGIRSWLLEANDCVPAFKSIAKNAMMTGHKSTDREKESIMGLATLVVDKLLSSVRQGENNARRSSRSGPSSGWSSPKRRRLDPGSEWNQLLRSCLDLLREYKLHDEAYRLAEKYGDYGTMMMLKVGADDFNTFMANGVDAFGAEFANYAFRWLEDRGKIELLLRGREGGKDNNDDGNAGYKNEPFRNLLRDYFNSDRRESSNLAWMHMLTIGDVNKAAQIAFNQMRQIAIPDKPSSRGNTRFLSSIAKLAFLFKRETGQDFHREDQKCLEEASAHLNMVSTQETMADDTDILKNGTDTIHYLVDNCDTESEVLSQNVLKALEVSEICATLNDKGQAEKDYVWRRCVGRQANLWKSLSTTLLGRNDVEIREELMNTALFMVAQNHEISEIEVGEMLDRGLLQDIEPDNEESYKRLSELVRTTITLATSA